MVIYEVYTIEKGKREPYDIYMDENEADVVVAELNKTKRAFKKVVKYGRRGIHS